MAIRTILLATATAAMLLGAPAWAGDRHGQIVSIGEGTITVTSDGKTTTYVVPENVQIQDANQKTIRLPELEPGQVVLLSVQDPAQASQQASATTIRILVADEDDDDDDDDD